MSEEELVVWMFLEVVVVRVKMGKTIKRLTCSIYVACMFVYIYICLKSNAETDKLLTSPN